MNTIDMNLNFYGRAITLDVLNKRIKGLTDGFRQNVALLGSRYIGKTALLRQVMAQVDDHNVILVYVDLENRDLPYLAQQLNKSLLYHYLKKLGNPVQDDLAVLCASARAHVPQTVGLIEAVQSLAQEDKIREAYHALLTVPEIFSQETGQKVVLILDEFHILGDFGIDEVFSDLGKRLMTQKNTLNIFASSQPTLAREIFNEKLSLLFGNFEILDIGPLTFNEAIGLIDHNLQGLNIGLQLKNFIVDFTGSHPLYINLLCQELIAVAAIYRQQEIYAPALTQAIENLIFNPWGVINRHFELHINAITKHKSGGLTVQVLCALAAGFHKISDIIEHLSVKPNQLNNRVSMLLGADIVGKNGNYHHIKDKLFTYWLKYVLSRRLQSVELEHGRMRRQFKDELNRAINEFAVTSRKDLTTRFSELIHKFDNEAFTLNGRRYKLNRFTDIKPMRLRTTAGHVYEAMTAQADDENWLVILKKDPLWEHELNLLNEQIKNLEPKPSRCVVVALNGLEDNARVRALAQKMWVWEEGDINALMHLFDEPALVK